MSISNRPNPPHPIGGAVMKYYGEKMIMDTIMNPRNGKAVKVKDDHLQDWFILKGKSGEFQAGKYNCSVRLSAPTLKKLKGMILAHDKTPFVCEGVTYQATEFRRPEFGERIIERYLNSLPIVITASKERKLKYWIVTEVITPAVPGNSVEGLVEAAEISSRRRVREIEQAAAPLFRYLKKLPHPHFTILVTPDGVEVLEGQVRALSPDKKLLQKGEGPEDSRFNIDTEA